jgi:TrmH family RNA methyltransferase
VTETVQRWRNLTTADAPPTVLLDGFHTLKHALRFHADIPLAVASDRAAALALAADLAPDVLPALEAHLEPVTPETLRTLVPRPHPTGVAALARKPTARAARTTPAATPAAARAAAPTVVLDNPRHLGNIGAVVRLAAGCGAAAVLTTGTVDPWHPTVVRAAAGLHFATHVAHGEGPEDLPSGPLYALAPEGEDLRTLALPDDALLAFGSERHGLSRELRARADHLVALPMRPQVSSYNLATSVAMTLYHWMAQRPAGGAGTRR